ncbi:MAG: hypothetical protein QM755_07675 [Luteolibacter sp.]
MSESVDSTVVRKRHRAFGVRGLMVLVGLIVLGLALLGLFNRSADRARRKAKNLTSRATASTIQTAINSFYSEYNRLPDPRTSPAATDATFDTASAEGVKLLAILMGRETGDDQQNTKRLSFLVVHQGRNERDGAIYSGGKIEKLVDPFGQGYRVAIDYDGNGQLTLPDESGPPGILSGHRAAAYSLGESGKGGGDAIRGW